jgi:hypothetical protein
MQGILHSLHNDFQQRGMGTGVVLPPQRRARPPPYTGKVLREKADSWWHGLSPSSRQDRPESVLLVLKSLADAGLGAASVLANLHHRWIIPLMERGLRIFEMEETANPVVLRTRGWYTTVSPRTTRLRGRGAQSTLRLSRTATTTSGRLLCFPTARW